jgi:multidrug efflux system membrane fusion protein
MRRHDKKERGRMKSNWIAVAALMPLLLLAAGCGTSSENVQAASGKSGNTPGGPPAPAVTVAVAGQRQIPNEISAIGNVQAYRSVQVKSMVDGQIDKVLLHQGDDVKAGQLLFQLDKRPFQAALDQSQAKLAQDEATSANSQAQAQRATTLLQQGILAAQDAQATQSQAKANAAAVQADKAAVETAKLNLGYTDIRAPISGRAGAILINLGNLVKANDTNPLTTINQLQPVYVSFNVPETALSSIRAKGAGHLQVRAALQNEPAPESGTLTFIDNAVDATTGTIRLMATFPNRNERLWPGAFSNVTLQTGVNAHAVVVPAVAIQTGPQGKYVYVIGSDGIAGMRTVKTSQTYGQLAVVDSGVSPGEQVVVDGQIRVIPGRKVNVARTVPLPEPAPASNESASLSGTPQ